ncbi:MAG: NUDIX hydrolase [Dermatophilaceae bacterium]
MATPPRHPAQPGTVIPAPADRPHQVRRAVRVVLTDDRDRVLLIKDSDLGLDPVRHWWLTPGGGVEPGETDVDAAVRELHEETGLRITPADLDGPLLIREVIHGYSDTVVHQTEVFFHVQVPGFDADTSGHTEAERLTVADIRWWTSAELAVTGDDVWPRDLAEIRALAAAPDRWRAGPVTAHPVEESTLPAGRGRPATGISIDARYAAPP